MGARAVSPDVVRATLQRVLTSSLFEGAGRSRSLLSFIIEQYAAGQISRLKEYTIGAEALGRGESFDPRTDPIVRAEASRLRARLERYYASEGLGDPITIVLPRGSYVPEFVERDSSQPRAVAPPAAAFPAGRRHWKVLWIASAALIIVATAIILLWGPRLWQRSREPQVIQFDVELKSSGVLGSEVGTDMALSPSGSRLVFVSRDSEGVAHLNTRALNESAAIQLSGTEGVRNPFFSPDGEWVAFWADGELKKVPVDGGSPVVLCDATDLLGGDWGENGYMVASLGGNKLWRIPANGGAPAALLDLTAERSLPVWPQILSNGDVLFTNVGFTGPNGANIELLNITTGKRTKLARGGTFGRYLENGYLTYINQGTLFAIQLDLDRIRTLGNPTPVLEHVSYSPAFGYAQLSFSRTGAVIFRRDTAAELVIESLEQNGKRQTVLAQPGHYLWPRVSPDGKALAFSTTESGVSSLDLQTGRVTRTPVVNGLHLPLWTPDGRFLVVAGLEGGLTWIRADGSGKPESLLSDKNVAIPWSFSPDGRRLAFHRLSPATGFDLWTVIVRSSETGLTAESPEPFLQTPAFETYPSFSPDGKWISYASNDSGNWEVYVRRFPDNGQKVQVSQGGGRISFWSPKGHELFYRTDNQRIMVADYLIRAGSFNVKTVRPWPHARLADTGVLANLDLAPDGQHFLFLAPATTPENQQTENHATFILNFDSQISRRNR